MKPLNITLTGKVIHGNGYGKRIGFPTANIDRRSLPRPLPKEGIYGGSVLRTRTNKFYRAGIVIGPKDTKGLPKIEAHLIDFKGNLYGERLVFFPKKFLHPFKVYKNEEALKKGIKSDIEKIKIM